MLMITFHYSTFSQQAANNSPRAE